MEALFENVSPNEDCSFRCQQLTSSSFKSDHNWHYHPEFELIWIINNEGTQFVGDNISPSQSGDLIFLGPNLPHCWYSYNEDTAPETPLKWIVTQFKKESFGSGFLKLPEAEHIQDLFQRSARGLKIHGQTAESIKLHMKAMLTESGLSKVLILLSVLDILAEASETTPLASLNYQLNCDVNANNLKRIEVIQNYTRDNLSSDICQPEIAEKVGLTPQAFSRFFKNTAGLTYVAFVNELRISKACHLLIECELDITQISFECGYQNISNFNRQFQKQKGKTPSDFRNLHRLLKQTVNQSQRIAV